MWNSLNRDKDAMYLISPVVFLNEYLMKIDGLNGNHIKKKEMSLQFWFLPAHWMQYSCSLFASMLTAFFFIWINPPCNMNNIRIYHMNMRREGKSSVSESTELERRTVRHAIGSVFLLFDLICWAMCAHVREFMCVCVHLCSQIISYAWN